MEPGPVPERLVAGERIRHVELRVGDANADPLLEERGRIRRGRLHVDEDGGVVPHLRGPARKQVHVAARERDAHARMLEGVCRKRRLAGIHQRLGAQRVGQSKLLRARAHPLHVLEPAEDAPVPRRHRLEETHAVLEPRVERGDRRLGHGDERAVEPGLEHGGRLAAPGGAATRPRPARGHQP